LRWGRLLGQFARREPCEFEFLLRFLERIVFGLLGYRHKCGGCDLDDDGTR
jgi:hypothetical protein